MGNGAKAKCWAAAIPSPRRMEDTGLQRVECDSVPSALTPSATNSRVVGFRISSKVPHMASVDTKLCGTTAPDLNIGGMYN